MNWTTKHTDRRSEEMHDIYSKAAKADSASARKVRNRTYVLPGYLGGLAAGGAVGAKLGRKGDRLVPGIIGAGLGGAAGALTGQYIERPRKKKDFTMNKVNVSRLVELNAHFDSRLEEVGFAQRREDEKPSGLKKAAVATGALGAAALGGTYLRGRRAIAKSGAPVLMKDGKAVMPGVGATLRAGAGALKGDASTAAGYVGDKLSSAGTKAKDWANRKRLGVEGRVGKFASERGGRA
jgi:hypothetical protein